MNDKLNKYFLRADDKKEQKKYQQRKKIMTSADNITSLYKNYEDQFMEVMRNNPLVVILQKQASEIERLNKQINDMEIKFGNHFFLVIVFVCTAPCEFIIMLLKIFLKNSF